VRLITWPYPNEEDLNGVDIYFSEQGAATFATDLTKVAATDRIPRLSGLRERYPWQLHMLEHQARTPRSPRSNDVYPLELYFAGTTNETPLTAERDAKRMGDWEERGRAQMRTLEERIGLTGNGVRSNDPDHAVMDLGGYRFVLPGWWDDVHPEMPPADINDFAKVVNWIAKKFGPPGGGEDDWQEALKISITRVGASNPTMFGAAYFRAGRKENAAVAAMDIADLLRNAPPEHPLFFSAPHYESTACLQAGLSCSELGLHDATQYWLRRCLCTATGPIAQKALELLKSMPTT
jgi:hypothetical protein